MFYSLKNKLRSKCVIKLPGIKSNWLVHESWVSLFCTLFGVFVRLCNSFKEMKCMKGSMPEWCQWLPLGGRLIGSFFFLFFFSAFILSFLLSWEYITVMIEKRIFWPTVSWAQHTLGWKDAEAGTQSFTCPVPGAALQRKIWTLIPQSQS